MRRVRRCVAGLLATFALGGWTHVAAAQERGAVALGDLVEGLGMSTRVLMIGAHPDDEDTNLIAWLARGEHVETAYLSLTRGDGGQNLIGNELGSMLGMIRTQELLAARRIDGGHQYFTRAFDFGFSKTDSETYVFWPKALILQDMVSVIRAFRPQVIVSVWSGTPADGHGHHQVSGQLAREAFDAAGDSVRFPSSVTSNLPPWTPLKFYRSARTFPGAPPAAVPPGPTVTFDVGEYNPLYGRSYAEIAAESRSQHLSQGMGQLQRKGAQLDRVRLEVTHGTPPVGNERSMFDGIDTSWARFASLRIPAAAHAALDSLGAAIATVRQHLDLLNPAPLVAPLGRVVTLLTRARNAVSCPQPVVPQCGGAMGDLATSLNTARDRATSALLQAAGVAIEATAERERVAAGDSVPVTIAVYNRGHSTLAVLGGTITAEGTTIDLGKRNVNVLPDSDVRLGGNVTFARPTVPWWLVNEQTRPGIFDLPSTGPGVVIPQLIMGEDRIATSNVELQLRVGGTDVTTTVAPLVYRFADPARGELQHPVVGVPRVSVLMEHEVEYARANVPFERMYGVHLQSGLTVADTVRVTLTVPRGLAVDSAARTVVIPAQASASVFFRVKGTLRPGEFSVSADARDAKQSYGSGYFAIDYTHIEPLRFYRGALIKISSVDVNVPANLTVAYVRGVGDNVEPMLEQLGIKTTMVDPASLPMLDPTTFTTLVIGPRAFGANDALVANAGWVVDFAKNGGTVVTQYGQTEMTHLGMLPYPITLSRTADRVTDENATVTFLDSSARVLTTPNRITAADFAHWVQERALYMPHTFDSHYQALFSMHDPNDPPNQGALLTTTVGKGTYVYTTLSFFRQLPAGQPGAARLFVNLLSAGIRGLPPLRP